MSASTSAPQKKPWQQQGRGGGGGRSGRFGGGGRGAASQLSPPSSSALARDAKALAAPLPPPEPFTRVLSPAEAAEAAAWRAARRASWPSDSNVAAKTKGGGSRGDNPSAELSAVLEAQAALGLSRAAGTEEMTSGGGGGRGRGRGDRGRGGPRGGGGGGRFSGGGEVSRGGGRGGGRGSGRGGSFGKRGRDEWREERAAGEGRAAAT